MFNVLERSDTSPTVLTVLGASTTAHTVKTSLYGAQNSQVGGLPVFMVIMTHVRGRPCATERAAEKLDLIYFMFTYYFSR